jgi:predicted metalloenzyme YecM
MKIKEIIGDHESFLDRIFENLREAGFELSEFEELDHVGIRTQDLGEYDSKKKELIELSETCSEKFFGGRDILVCRLRESLNFKGFEIPGIELLAPKEGKFFESGLEHAEFVVKEGLDDFMKRHGDVNFDLRAFDRYVNPELVVEFEDCAAKFHEQSLLEVREI